MSNSEKVGVVFSSKIAILFTHFCCLDTAEAYNEELLTLTTKWSQLLTVHYLATVHSRIEQLGVCLTVICKGIAGKGKTFVTQ